MSKIKSNNRKPSANASMDSTRAAVPAVVISDSRFSHIASDPKFRRLPKKDRKVRVDSRFQSMFNDERFTLKYSVDKRGRPVHRSAKENLKRYYELENSESEKEEEDGEGSEKRQRDAEMISQLKLAKKKTKLERQISSNSDAEEESDIRSARVEGGAGCDEDLNDTQALERLAQQMLSGDATVTKVIKNGRNVCSPQSAEDSDEESDIDSSAFEVSDPEDHGSRGLDDESQIRLDLARGEGNVSSSSDDSSSEWEFEEEAVVHDWGELDRSAPVTEESTARLAICHLDWDRIRAVDLLVLLNSFKPVDGLVKSVSIYRSEFGKERIKKDEEEGPVGLKEDSDADSDSEALTPELEEERQRRRRERLRVYELNKLKYYYAIAEMDSVATADKVYSECNGSEFESCAIKLDLRFVPDSMTFEDGDLKERATKVDAGSYKPRIFTNQALQQSNVKLSWDENDYDREQLVRKAFDEETVETLDIQDYVASSSEEDEDDNVVNSTKQPNKYAALLSIIGNADSAADPFKNKKSIPRTTETMSDTLQGFEDNISDSEEDGRLLIGDNFGQSSKFGKKPCRLTAAEPEVAKVNRSSSNPDPSMKLSFRERQRQKRMEVKQRKMNKQKLRESTASSSIHMEPEQAQVFSDDELPDGVDLDDPYFRDELESQDVCSNMPDKSRKLKKGRVTKSKHGSPHNDTLKCDTEKPRGEEDQLRLLVEDSGDKNESKRHFHMRDLIKEAELSRKLNKKGKGRNAKLDANGDLVSAVSNKNDDDFRINPADSRFSAIYSSSLFNIDPSDPAYKATIAMESIVKEKLRKTTAGNAAKIGKNKEDTLFSGDTKLPSGGNAGCGNNPSDVVSKGAMHIGEKVPGPTLSGGAEDINTRRLIEAVKLKSKRLSSKKKVRPDRVVPSN